MLRLKVTVGNVREVDFSNKNYSAVLIQYPDTNGDIFDYEDLVKRAHDNGVCFRVQKNLRCMLHVNKNHRQIASGRYGYNFNVLDLCCLCDRLIGAVFDQTTR